MKIRFKTEINRILAGRIALDDDDIALLKGFVSDLAATYSPGAPKLTTADTQTLRDLARALSDQADLDEFLMDKRIPIGERIKAIEQRAKASNAVQRRLESLSLLVKARAGSVRQGKEAEKAGAAFDGGCV